MEIGRSSPFLPPTPLPLLSPPLALLSLTRLPISSGWQSAAMAPTTCADGPLQNAARPPTEGAPPLLPLPCAGAVGTGMPEPEVPKALAFDATSLSRRTRSI